MHAGWALAGVLLVPLLCIAGVHRPMGRRLAAWAPLPALLAALGLPAGLALEMPGLLLGSALMLDPLGAFFLALTALVWLVAGLHARHWLEDDPHAGRFMVFFMLAQTGNLGLCIAQDAISFYLFFALMSFAAYGLVVHAGDAAARRAGRVYLGMAVLGEVALLVGLLWMVGRGDAPGAVPWLLLGFGVKVGLPGLHVWLPLAHPVAPAPASAVLSGVMLKAGLLGWLRFLPLGEMALPEPGGALMLAGGLAMGLGILFGLMQDSAKVVLAYSSISQMGAMSLAVGAGLTAPAAWPVLLPALLLYAGHHALVKSALFLGAGWIRRSGARRRDWIMLALPALALAGAPLTGGQLAKSALAGELSAPGLAGGEAIAVLFVLASLGSALLMARMFVCLRATARPGPPAGMPVPLLVWMAVAGLLPLLIAGQGTDLVTPAALAKAAAPILLAAAMVALILRRGWHVPAMPPGDGLVLAEILAGWLRPGVRTVRAEAERQSNRRDRFTPDWPDLGPRIRSTRGWRGAGLVWLLLLGLLLAAGWA